MVAMEKLLHVYTWAINTHVVTMGHRCQLNVYMVVLTTYMHTNLKCHKIAVVDDFAIVFSHIRSYIANSLFWNFLLGVY